MDHSIKNRQRLFLRFSYWNILDLPIDPLGSGLCADRCSENTTAAPWPPGTLTLSRDGHFGFNVSVSRFSYNRTPKNSGFDLTTLGWPASYNQSVPAVMRTPPPCVANFADNIICTQGQSFIQDRKHTVKLIASVSMLRGRHQYQVGFQFEVGRDNYAQSNIASGAFDFCFPAKPASRVCPGSPGPAFSFADFLLGYADNFQQHRKPFFCAGCVPASQRGSRFTGRSILPIPGTQPTN